MARLANYAMLLVAFDGLLLRAVDWTADATNAASVAVMQRLGGRQSRLTFLTLRASVHDG